MRSRGGQGAGGEDVIGGLQFYRVHKRYIYERTADRGAIGAVRARVGTTVLMPHATHWLAPYACH